MKRLTLAALLSATALAVAQPVSTGTVTTTGTAEKIAKLTEEYRAVEKRVEEGKQHLLRLEGAVSILQQLQAEDKQTSGIEAQPKG